MSEQELIACFLGEPLCPNDEYWLRQLPNKRFYIESLSPHENYLRYFSQKDVTYGSEIFQDLNVILPRSFEKGDQELTDYLIDLFFNQYSLKGVTLPYSGNYSLLLPSALRSIDNYPFLQLFDLFMLESRYITPEEISIFFQSAIDISYAFGENGYVDSWYDLFLPAVRKYLTPEEMSTIKLHFLLGLVAYNNISLLQTWIQSRYPRISKQDLDTFYLQAVPIAVKNRSQDMIDFLIKEGRIPTDEVDRIIVTSAIYNNIPEWYQEKLNLVTDISTCNPDLLKIYGIESLTPILCSKQDLETILPELTSKQQDLVVLELARLGKYDLLELFPNPSKKFLAEGAAIGGHIDLLMYSNLNTPQLVNVAVDNFNITTLLYLTTES